MSRRPFADAVKRRPRVLEQSQQNSETDEMMWAFLPRRSTLQAWQLEGKCFKLATCLSATTLPLKQELETIPGVPSAEIYFFANDKLLVDESKVADYGC